MNHRDLAELRTLILAGTLRATRGERLEAIVRGRDNRSRSNSDAEGRNYLQPFGALNLAAAAQNGFITPVQLGTIFNGSATPATQVAAEAALADLTTKDLHPASYTKFYRQPTAAKKSPTSGSLLHVADMPIGKRSARVQSLRRRLAISRSTSAACHHRRIEWLTNLPSLLKDSLSGLAITPVGALRLVWAEQDYRRR